MVWKEVILYGVPETTLREVYTAKYLYIACSFCWAVAFWVSENTGSPVHTLNHRLVKTNTPLVCYFTNAMHGFLHINDWVQSLESSPIVIK